jgi:hypothetical protein
MSKFGSKVMRSASALKNAPKTPKVMMIAGVTTIVGAGVFACVQTLKLESHIDDAKEEIDHIKDLKEEGEYVIDTKTGETAEYTEKLYRKDLTYTYFKTAIGISKLYLPSLLATGVGVALVGGSHKIMSDRLTQTSLALTCMGEAFNKYRKNVIDDQGEEADQRYMTGMQTKKNLEMSVVDPETGEVITKKEKKIDVIDSVNNIASPYSVILNDCGFWTSDADYNTAAIDAFLNILQAQYDRDGYIYLYDIWQTFGALPSVSPKAIAMSHQVGLVKGVGDDDIRVNLIPTHLGSEDIYKQVLLMDINCCGPINNLVAERAWTNVF